MAGIATILSVVSTIAGTLVSAAGARAEGKAAQAQANYQASVQEKKAKQEQAERQLEAQDQERETKLILSAHQAKAAASGFDASDPSNILEAKKIAGRGEFYKQVKMYGGEQERYNLEADAAASRANGRAAAQAARYKVAGTLIGGASSLFGQFSKMPQTQSSSTNYRYS